MRHACVDALNDEDEIHAQTGAELAALASRLTAALAK